MSYTTAPLLALVRDPAELGRVTRVFATVIEKSFEEDGSRSTGAEVKRRFEIVYNLFMELRRDCGWSVTRCLDNLPIALRSKLDGGSWEPSTQSRWVTTERVVEEEVDSDPKLWTPERARLGIVE